MLRMYVCAPCVSLVPQSTEEGVGSHGTGDIDGCEPLCGCWESNLSPLKEQQIILTAELSLQFQNINVLKI